MGFNAEDSFTYLGHVWPQNLTVNQLVVGSIPTAGAKLSHINNALECVIDVCRNQLLVYGSIILGIMRGLTATAFDL